MLRTENEAALEKLYRFFRRNLLQTFADLSLQPGREIVSYLADRLTFFARTEHLYRISQFTGNRLETVVDMLLELEHIRTGALRDPRQQELLALRHLGDFTLFMSGIFREYVSGLGVLDLYLQKGEFAYRRLTRLSETPDVQRLFRQLGQHFEAYSGALDYMKKVYFYYEPISESLRPLLDALTGGPPGTPPLK